MLIAVEMENGPSPQIFDVRAVADELMARKLALLLAYEGHTNLDEAEADLEPDVLRRSYVVTPTVIDMAEYG